MWTCHPTRRAHETQQCTALHRVAHRNARGAHVEVRGEQSRAMVHVHRIATEIEIVDESHHATIRRMNGSANRTGVIRAHMPRGNNAIEFARIAERARDATVARRDERCRPETRRVVCDCCQRPRQLRLALLPRSKRRIGRCREIGCDTQAIHRIRA